MNAHDKNIWVTVLLYYFGTMIAVLLGASLLIIPIAAAGCFTSVYVERRAKIMRMKWMKYCASCRRPLGWNASRYGTFGYCCSSQICQEIMRREWEEQLVAQ